MPVDNPTRFVDLNFDHYLQARKRELGAHLIDGVPDYALPLDQKLRQQLAAIPPIRLAVQAMVSIIVKVVKQFYAMEGVAVTPRQYPEIYKIGEECARRLGIGIPQIFVTFSPILNGFTLATEDVAPVVILSSALVEGMSANELKFVIGHECGHIHNLHGVYNTAVQILTNELASVVFRNFPLPFWVYQVTRLSVFLFFARWSRFAEATCDRAGLICCGDLTDAQMALAKLAVGGGRRLSKINLEEYVKQIEQVRSSPIRLLELLASHPLIHKRVETLRHFSECDTLFSWRPEMRTTDTVRTKLDVDRACNEILFVTPGNKKTPAE